MSYIVPQKTITDPAALQRFLESPTCVRYVQFLEDLNESVKGLPNDASVAGNENIDKIIAGLVKISALVDTVAPIPQAMRYGNKAFQNFLDKVDESIESLHQEMLPQSAHPAIIELSTYFSESFGNRTRIDYGTGHETNFIAWLFCLEQLGLWKKENHSAVVLKVFMAYLSLMRKIQKKYMLEPAGSHGVWSLDDYHFLPFYFGSSQLRGHPNIKPSSIRNKDIYTAYGDKFMYLGMIRFINEVKTGPFFEHSQILDSVANAIHWDKVNQGMMKMYKGEVLGKFPVMQHFFFGNLIPFH
jgi:serine/threonine-protein phosphatase 2A activator